MILFLLLLLFLAHDQAGTKGSSVHIRIRAQRTWEKTHLDWFFPKSADSPLLICFPFTPNEPRRHTHPRDRPGIQPPGPPCFSPQMGLGSSQEKQGNHQGLKAEVSEPQGNVQNASAKGPEHSAHTRALTVISGQSTPLQCCPLPSWATNSAPAG